jgi:glycosyltransferase involved in cell wall biosynthesis
MARFAKAPIDPLRICVVIPVFNHGSPIGAVVGQVRDFDLPVIVVDDGSDADCAERVRALERSDNGIEVLRLPRNGGKGAAFYTGARYALGRGFSHALQVDADGQHDLGAIPHALAMMEQHPQSLIAGAPVFDETVPTKRLYGRYLTNGLVWLHTWSWSIRDALCGFRVYPLADTVSLANRQPVARRMDFDIDVAVRLVWDNVDVRTVRVAVCYPKAGISHFDLRWDNLRIAGLHARLFGGMLIRAPLLAAQRLRHFARQLTASH